MDKLIEEIRTCTLCAQHLPLGPRPVIRVGTQSKILVIGQAPGTRVHASGLPWDDLSGRELRRWLGVDSETFYNTDYFGIMPMGFCYPGKGKGGDMPPRQECAPMWHEAVRSHLPQIKLTLLIGAYSQAYYLRGNRKINLTETVRAYDEYLPQYFPLVHPSPRNKRWQKKNPWFEDTVVPHLQEEVQNVLNANFSAR